MITDLGKSHPHHQFLISNSLFPPMLYFFYGEECPHCHVVMPIVDKLIQEGLIIEKRETWHNSENATLFEQKDQGTCGGVPFFYNDSSGASICGETSEEEIRAWANG